MPRCCEALLRIFLPRCALGVAQQLVGDGIDGLRRLPHFVELPRAPFPVAIERRAQAIELSVARVPSLNEIGARQCFART